MLRANSKIEQGTSGEFDGPVRLIRAPQPAMPPRAVESRMEGQVTVRVLFNEAKVQEVCVDQSSSELLTAAVLDAVRQWEITPATRKGARVKFGLQQAFVFRTAW